LARDPEGFTSFARLAEAALVARLAAYGVAVVERRVGDESMLGDEDGRWVELALSDPRVRLYVYADQIDVIGNGVQARIEHSDAHTPAQARQAALAALDRALGDPRPPAL
jgi:hypothetical protein